MTREAIEQQAKSYTLAIFDKLDDLSDITDAYVDGAEWMQEIMIEKACKWILHNMHKYVKWYPTESLTVCVNNEDMANGFKQAMEE